MNKEYHSTYINRLLLLKELDKVIDFSKASNQLIIILNLYALNKFVSVSELIRITGFNRKTILDSLRKLQKKNLIVKKEINHEIHVALSEYGKEYMRNLLAILTPRKEIDDDALLKTAVRLALYNELNLSLCLYRLVTNIGMNDDRDIEVDALMPRSGCDNHKARIILASFTRNPTRVFRLYERRGRKCIKLDKKGYELLYKTYHYKAYIWSKTYRFLQKIFQTPWIIEMALKGNALISLLYSIPLILKHYGLIHETLPVLAIIMTLQIGFNILLHYLKKKHNLF